MLGLFCICLEANIVPLKDSHFLQRKECSIDIPQKYKKTRYKESLISKIKLFRFVLFCFQFELHTEKSPSLV